MKQKASLLRMAANAFVALVVAHAIGCSPKPSQNRVTIFVSGDTAGWITPCGCAANQSGGLPRRAALIHGAGSEQNVLLLDAGGSASGTSEYHLIKMQAILDGYRQMDLAAHNIGGPESALSPIELKKLAADSGVKWVSANLTTQDLEVPKLVTVERGGLKIAITGVTEPSRVVHKSWSASEPVQSVLNALAGATKADVRIVLAYYDEAGLKKLAESLPEVDFIVGGPTGQAMNTTEIGPTRVLSATNKGKFLAKIEVAKLHDKLQVIRCGPAEVRSDLAEDEKQLTNLKEYYATLEKRNFTAMESGIVQTMHNANFKIAGTEACTKCHTDDHTRWETSKHSQAWLVLQSKGAHVDPYCQQCHTTGYAVDGGFQGISLTPERVNVGCENCHGPSSAHAANPKKKTPYQSREQCLRCHDHENSPEFKYYPYWMKVQHGAVKAILN
jgi:Cytochrome c554 and c-prime